MVNFSVVVSVNSQNIIGVGDELFIHCKDDLRRFYQITTDFYTENEMNICIMGYNTWYSIPEDVRPLKKRINIVLTRDHVISEDDTLMAFISLEDALRWSSINCKGKIFVIGGESIFRQCISYQKDIESIYCTKFKYDYKELYKDNNKDIKYFPIKLFTDQKLIYQGHSNDSMCTVEGNKEEKIIHNLYIYQKEELRNKDELAYLYLLRKIMDEGEEVGSRNGKVRSLFGKKLEFDLSEGFPLLTTKKMGSKTILRELLWFIRGSTANQELNEKKVHIWDQNASREFLDSRGLSYEEGDLGPVYGFQWRHFGAEYIDSKTDYKDQGIDQLKNIIHLLKTDPTSRRIIMNAWNAKDIDKMALPPCHVMCQFNVNQEKKSLNCQMYQRSGDMFLGVPYNIASYAYLTYILAHIVGLSPGKLILVLGDAHIYESHLGVVEEQLRRVPMVFPRLEISDELKDIDNIHEEYFEIIGYKSMPKLSAPMIA